MFSKLILNDVYSWSSFILTAELIVFPLYKYPKIYFIHFITYKHLGYF